MNAMYFLERLRNYKNEKEISKMSYDGYEGHSVTIHRKNALLTYYDIFMNGTVHKAMDREIQILPIEDLEGDDFELFNTRQIVECGYIVNADNSKVAEQIRKTVIDYIANKQFESPVSDYKLIGPGLRFTIMGTEIVVLTDEQLEPMNKSRKYYGANIIPFNDNHGKCRLHFQIITNIERRPVMYVETDKITKEVLNLFRNACNNDNIEIVRRYLIDPIYL